MRPPCLPVLLLGVIVSAQGAVTVTVGHNSDDDAVPGFVFSNVPFPANDDAATQGKFTIVDGEKEPGRGALEKLNDGKLPTEEDQPSENFYFKSFTAGGRLQLDLGRIVAIRQVNTYSWHPNVRGPQVYRLYASDGTAPGFNPAPKHWIDPATCGWTLIAEVDTRSNDPRHPDGGQYGVSIADSSGLLGHDRYLLFDIAQTETEDGWGNTYYSEINVVDANAPPPGANPNLLPVPPDSFSFDSADGKCHFIFDATADPAMLPWVRDKLAPVLAQWYPKVAAMLPSDGFTAPTRCTITIKPLNPVNGIAYTVGTNITVGKDWLAHDSPDDAVGALAHETVHVVQRFGLNKYCTLNPGWLIEGSAEYFRRFIYEPEKHGADIEWVRHQPRSSLRYDGSYQISANFLEWVTEKYDKDIVAQMNAEMRQGKYDNQLWQQYTGKPLEELGREWKAELVAQLAAAPAN